MESVTKNRCTEEQIYKMIYKAFGKSDLEDALRIKELKGGAFNVAYRVSMPDREVIIKVAPPEEVEVLSYEKNLMYTEVWALRLVKEKTKVPVPAIFYYDMSHEICNSDYFIMECIDGVSLDVLKEKGLASDIEDKIMEQVGRYNRMFNDIKGEVFGYPGIEESQGIEWSEVFENMIRMLLEDGMKLGVDIGVSYEEIIHIIDQSKNILKTVAEPSFIHWDLWEGNIFIKNDEVVGIIDFERVIWADPLMEYAFRRCSIKEAFNKGYGENLRTHQPIRGYLYDLYMFLIMAIESHYRQYTDNGYYEWARKQLIVSVEELRKLI